MTLIIIVFFGGFGVVWFLQLDVQMCRCVGWVALVPKVSVPSLHVPVRSSATYLSGKVPVRTVHVTQ